jgi:SepF-like predicted cell division protein (DUF552 family)
METENMAAETGAEETTDAFAEAFNEGDTEASAPEAETTTPEQSKAEQPGQKPDAQKDQPEADQPTTDPKPDADQPKEKSAEESGKQPEQTPEQSEPTVHVTYMQQEKDLSLKEAAELAQKGMDYDRIRTKYDESKPVMETMKALSEKAGMDVTAFLSYIRTQTKRQEGMNEDEAKRAIALEDREADVSRKEAEQKAASEEEKQQTAAKETAENSRKADFQKFAAKYPGVKAQEIPKDVWTAVGRGASLVEAYQDHLIAQMKAETEAKEQNRKNAAASSGSMKTAGNERKSNDPFLDAFLEG